MVQRGRLLTLGAAALVVGVGVVAAVGVAASPPASKAADAADVVSGNWPAHVFAPYVDAGLYYNSNSSLADWAGAYGTKYYSLAFVNGSGCSWSLPSESTWAPEISALQSAGGGVSISFGGYTVDSDGTDLGAQCSSASAMAAQVESVVTTLGVTHLDFDIESDEMTNSSDYTRTAQALAQVRTWATSSGHVLGVNYTLPVMPTGLTSSGLSVLQAAQSAGFTPNVVNLMTMDYGSSGTEMGQAADQALDASAAQVADVFGVSGSTAYSMLGVTPMIGQNDSQGEVFTLADAATVESYAESKGIAWLSMWSEGRDNGGCSGSTSASSTCSGLSQSTGQFTQAFQAFDGGGGTIGSTAEASASDTATTATSQPSASPTPASQSSAASATSSPTASVTGGGGGCGAAWDAGTSYDPGAIVSYDGDNFTASYYSTDVTPGSAIAWDIWTSDGSC